MPAPLHATDQDRAPPVGALQESVGQWSGPSAWQREPKRRYIRRAVDQYVNEIRRWWWQLRGHNHDSGLPPGNRTPVGQIAPLGKAALLAGQRNVVHRRPAAAASDDVRARCARAGDWHRSRARGPQQPTPHTRGPSRAWHRAQRDSRIDTLALLVTFGGRSPPATGREREGAHQTQQGRSTW